MSDTHLRFCKRTYKNKIVPNFVDGESQNPKDGDVWYDENQMLVFMFVNEEWIQCTGPNGPI